MNYGAIVCLDLTYRNWIGSILDQQRAIEISADTYKIDQIWFFAISNTTYVDSGNKCR
jgi:hypothetical protein